MWSVGRNAFLKEAGCVAGKEEGWKPAAAAGESFKRERRLPKHSRQEAGVGAAKEEKKAIRAHRSRPPRESTSTSAKTPRRDQDVKLVGILRLVKLAH